MRYRVILFLIVISAAFVVWAVWIANDGRGLFARRAASPDYAGLLTKLAEPTSLDAEDVPFRQLVGQLANRHGVTIRIDKDALLPTRVPPNRPVTVHTDEIALGSALRLIARLAHSDLCVVVDGEALVLIDREAADFDTTFFEGRVYPLSPLLFGSKTISADELSKTIRLLIAPQTWRYNGGTAVMEATPGGLAVAHRLEVHLQIEALLEKLQYLADHPDDLRPVVVTPLSPPGQARGEAALDRPITIRLTNTPLPQALAELSEQAGIPVLLDAAVIDENLSILRRNWFLGSGAQASSKLKDSNVSVRDETVTLNANARPLRDILDELRKDHRHALTVLVQDGAVWITVAQRVQPQLRLYPVCDLLPHTSVVPDAPCQDLIALLKVAGRPFAAHPNHIDNIGGVVAVLADHEIHRRVEQILAGLRELLDPMTERRIVFPTTPASTALAENTSIDVTHAELLDVLADLSKRHRIDIIYEKDRYAPDRYMRVTFRAENLSLEQALYHLLEPSQLTVTASENRLQVVDKSGLQHIPDGSFSVSRQNIPRELVCYDVRHLVDPDVGVVDLDQLSSFIKHLVEPNSWANPAQTTHAWAFDGILVMSHRRDVHRDLAALVSALEQYQRTPASLSPVLASTEFDAGLAPLAEALGQRVSLDYADISLDDLTADLTRRFGFPVDVNWESLESVGTAPRLIRVRGRVNDVSLATGLDMLLGPAGLTYTVRLGRMLLIAAGERANDRFFRVYPVHDLALQPAGSTPRPGGPNGEAPPAADLHLHVGDYASLVELVQRFVLLDTWNALFGGQYIDACQGALVVSQTWRAHRRLERLVGRLRGLLDPPSHPDRGLTHLERTLTTKTTLIADGVSLKDLLADVAQRHGILIHVDWPQPMPENIVCRFENVPLGDALADLVRPFRLWVVVQDEVLGLRELGPDVELPLITWVYDVRRLAWPSPPRPVMESRLGLPFGSNRSRLGGRYYPPRTTEANYDLHWPRQTVIPMSTSLRPGPHNSRHRDFADFVAEHVHPGTWAAKSALSGEGAGFFGAATESETQGATTMIYRGLLVVRHRWQVHREIRQLLRRLEEFQRELPPLDRLTGQATAADRTALLPAISATEDDQLTAYLLTLLRLAPPPAKAALPVLARKLDVTSPKKQGPLHSELCRALLIYRSEAADIVPLLTERLDDCPNVEVRGEMLRAITEIDAAAAGPQLGKLLSKIVARGPIDDTELRPLMAAILAAGPAAVDAVEPLLQILVMPAQCYQQRIHALCAIDAEGERSRQIVAQWKKAKDANTRMRVPVAEDRITDIYGDP